MNRYLFIVLVIVIIGAGGYLGYKRLSSSGNIYETKGVITAEVVNIESFAIGQISEVFVKEGDFIDAGQKLVEIDTILGRVGDNLTDESTTTIDSSSKISTIFSPVNGYVMNLNILKGDSVQLYAELLDIANLESYRIEAKFKQEWIPNNKIFEVGNKITWSVSQTNEQFEGVIDYIAPYLEEGDVIFNISLMAKPQTIYINQEVKVFF